MAQYPRAKIGQQSYSDQNNLKNLCKTFMNKSNLNRRFFAISKTTRSFDILLMLLIILYLNNIQKFNKFLFVTNKIYSNKKKRIFRFRKIMSITRFLFFTVLSYSSCQIDNISSVILRCKNCAQTASLSLQQDLILALFNN